MKKSQQYIGLPVIEISSGKQLGAVEAIAVNPDRGCIDFLLLEREKWYDELRALPYGLVSGVGEFAVTLEKGDSIHRISDNPVLVSLLERDVSIIKATVMTQTGSYVGTVLEYIIEEHTGIIKSLVVLGEDGNESIIPGDKVITYGSKALIIDEAQHPYVINEFINAMHQNSDSSTTDRNATLLSPNEAKEEDILFMNFALNEESDSGNIADDDSFDIFEARQRQFLLGKKVARRIMGDGFQVIIEEGDIITEEVIEKALSMDKYIELTMNIITEEDEEPLR